MALPETNSKMAEGFFVATNPNKTLALLDFDYYYKVLRRTVRADERKWLNKKGSLIQ